MDRKKRAYDAQISLEIDTRDTTRQEERALLDLLRSISIGKMIAVIGSGVTMTYGYDSWGSMLQKLVNRLAEMLREDEAAMHAHAAKDKLHFDQYGVEQARRFLAKDAQDNDDDYNLSIYSSLFPHLTEKGRNFIFETYRELFGARWLISRNSAAGAFPDLLLPGKDSPHLHQDFSHFLRTLAAFLDALEDPSEKNGKRSIALKKDAIRNTTGQQRIALDRPLIDPLEKLRYSLRIRRFTTFNYDLEIESLLEDYDYPSQSLTVTTDTDVSNAQSRLGSMARVISLSRKNASELIALAAIPADDDETVVHLHGSVNRPAEMVVSQQEYDSTYIDPHPQRNAFEDARKLMFGGNSVLYIGVGMQEEDVLRPLRYLASVVTERPIYALIPSTKSHEADLSFKKRIKAAYRINVIPYGTGSDNLPEIVRNLGVQHPIKEPFKPLHEELSFLQNHLKNLLLPDRERDISLCLTEEQAPRLAAGAPEYFQALRLLPAMIDEIYGRIGTHTKNFIENFSKNPAFRNFEQSLKSVVTSVALNHAVEIMALSGRKWRHQWKIRHRDSTAWTANDDPDTDVGENQTASEERRPAHQNTTNRSKNKADSQEKSPSTHDPIVIYDLHPIHLHGHAREDASSSMNLVQKLLGRHNTIDIIRFKKGRGLASFSSIAKYQLGSGAATDISFHIINLNHIISANPILPSLYKAIQRTFSDKNSEKTVFFLITGAERLMSRDGDSIQNLAALYFLHSLKKMANSFAAPRDTAVVSKKVKVVLLLRKKKTDSRLRKIFEIEKSLTENFAKTPIRINIDDSRYGTLHSICEKYRWPNFVIASLTRFYKDRSEREKLLDILESLIDSRIHSVDPRNHQSVFCGAALDAFHAHAQRNKDPQHRVCISMRNAILKWMFAIRIPVSSESLSFLPELRQIYCLHEASIEEKNRDLRAFIAVQLHDLRLLNFIFEISPSFEYSGEEPVSGDKFLAGEYREDTDNERSKTQESSLESRYVLHDDVAKYLAHKRGFSLGWMDHREWNSATLCNAMMDGGHLFSEEDYRSSCDAYEALLEQKVDAQDANSMILRESEASSLVRSQPLKCAYAIIRGHLYAPNAMRAGLIYHADIDDRSVIDVHVGRLSRLRSASLKINRSSTDLVQKNSTFGSKPKPPNYFEHFEVWLTNEIGVLKYVQGDFHDAVMLFRECLDFIENDKDSTYGDRRGQNDAEVAPGIGDDPAIVPRIRINLALALIERAHFEQARKLIDSALVHLETIDRAMDTYRDSWQSHDIRLRDSDSLKSQHDREVDLYLLPESNLLRALALGCRAQIQLLVADIHTARATIKEAFEGAENIDLMGVRGWLSGLKAQIDSASGDDKIAKAEWLKALAAARGSRRPDLILSLEIAETEFRIRQSRGDRASILSSLSTLSHLEKTAKSLGSHKARVGILLIRARALLFLEQTESSREAIIDAICLSLLNGMRLKRVSGLVLMVALMAMRGEADAARKLLRTVRLTATRYRYVRASLDIDRLEREIEMGGSISAWAGYLSELPVH